ncbi:MAG TPA: DUF177 domain-containing protein [Flavobacteriales bacterium]|nr:DUF177 domain-containing protein [Flavobacteriales bacterium]
MDNLRQYNVQFSGLSEDVHEFQYEIKDAFFKEFDNAVVDGGDIQVDLELDKQTNLMTLNFRFAGIVQVMCDRCAAVNPYPVEGKSRLILKLGEGNADDDELVILPRGEYEYNIAQHLYEEICLSLPLRVVPCEVTGDTSMCDQSVIDRLENMLVDELPEEGEEEAIDPRWEKLRNLNKETE